MKYHILNICSWKPACGFGKKGSIYSWFYFNFAQIVLEKLSSSFYIWERNLNDFIESACSFYGWVKRLLEISSPDYNNWVSFFKAVHFCENLVDCVSGISRVFGISFSSYWVDFVNKYYTRRLFYLGVTCSLAALNRFLILLAPIPTNISSNSAPLL